MWDGISRNVPTTGKILHLEYIVPPIISCRTILFHLSSTMDDITPLLSEERANEAGGLWATKQYGDFKVGFRT